MGRFPGGKRPTSAMTRCSSASPPYRVCSQSPVRTPSRSSRHLPVDLSCWTAVPPPSATTCCGKQSEGYFTLMRIRLLSGRVFNASDRPGNSDAAVVSRQFERQFFPEGAISRRFRVVYGANYELDSFSRDRRGGRREAAGVLR